jgi:hypothetical protein
MRFALAALAAFSLALALAAPAQAQTVIQYRQDPGSVLLVDPTTIATATAYQADMDLGRYVRGTCQLQNANDGGASRVLTVSCTDAPTSSGNILYIPAVAGVAKFSCTFRSR